METLKAIINFFKKKKVQLWACIMAGVIVIAFGVMSWIMVNEKVVFARINTFGLNKDGERTEVKLDFIPKLEYIDTITVSNNNEDLSAGTIQLNNNLIGGEKDPIVLKSEANAVKEIMKRLDRGRKTNAFMQFFTGGASGKEYLVNSFTGSWEFDEISNGVWIKIVFAIPQFVINYDYINQPWRIEEFNPNYTRPVDENGKTYGQGFSSYINNVITAIHIPLGNVRNVVTQQTWYLSIGSRLISGTSNLGYTYTTYGNYSSLLRYVKNLDDDFFWSAGK